MPYFDRFDICEAHLAIENDWQTGGWLPERPSNQRRKEATSVQLARIQFEPGAGFRGYDSLSDNGKEIYRELHRRYDFPCAECDEKWSKHANGKCLFEPTSYTEVV